MYDTIFLLVKATIQTTHKNVHEAIAEIQETATCTITNTKKVKIHELTLMDYKLKKA
ncbi:hypothetical protein BDD43_3561 [Mucilaginibacter gracilis]|uniref:Uncharacterized protein n=1 Tax=Mucilaginibacter gracilis TaxID=423350 RepID=A0A495J302_9SPHI|nr:hypothetical protein [Mucilaginibacter gracilis]RKR83355.1 hypothetical protein BDD43_3561 [Mucilaginibacter gracilis]